MSTAVATPPPLVSDFGRVIVFARDVLSCARFFRDKLGLQAAGQWSSVWADLKAGRTHIAFHRESAGHTTSLYPESAFKLIFTTADLLTAHRQLSTSGVDVSEIHPSEHGAPAYFFGYDPENHVFQFIQS